MKILVIENKSTIKKMLPDLTKEVNCEFEIVDDGLKAFRLFRLYDYDLIITTINVPYVNGWTLIRLVRQSMGSSIPIATVLSDDRAEDVELSRRLGANAHLRPPFDVETIVKMLADLLGDAIKLRDDG